MMSLQDLQTMAAGIKNETRVGGNTAERVGKAFECVADVIQQGIDGATIKLDSLNEFPATPQQAIDFVKKNGKEAQLTVMDREFSVGVLSIFTDAQAQVLTEVFETRLTLNNDKFTRGHRYNAPQRYWRNYGLRQDYNGIKKHEWTKWAVQLSDSYIMLWERLNEMTEVYNASKNGELRTLEEVITIITSAGSPISYEKCLFVSFLDKTTKMRVVYICTTAEISSNEKDWKRLLTEEEVENTKQKPSVLPYDDYVDNASVIVGSPADAGEIVYDRAKRVFLTRLNGRYYTNIVNSGNYGSSTEDGIKPKEGIIFYHRTSGDIFTFKDDTLKALSSAGSVVDTSAIEKKADEAKKKADEAKKKADDNAEAIRTMVISGGVPVVQEEGESDTNVMSQVAVTRALGKVNKGIENQLLTLQEIDKMYSFEVEDNFVASSQNTEFNNGFAFEIYRNIEKFPKHLVGLNFKKCHNEDRKIKLGVVDVLKKKVISVTEITVQADKEKVSTNLLVLPNQAVLFYDGVLSFPFDYKASPHSLFGATGSILSTESELVDLSTVKIQVLATVKSYIDISRLKKSPWEGKKIIVVGDSISDRSVYEIGLYNTGKALDPRSWVEVMRDELGCEVVNYGSSGHCMRYNGGEGFSASEAEHTASGKLPKRPHYDTALLGNLDADLFVFEYGVNDSGNLGTDISESSISEDNRNSYTTGMNYVLSKLFEAKPNARCVFVSHWVNIREIDKQIIAAQEAVAKKWNIPCIKWAELCGFSNIPCIKTVTVNGKSITFNIPQSTYSIMTMKGDATSDTIGDMCHPLNDDARITLGTIVARQLCSMY